MTLLSRRNLDSVEQLTAVTRAIYVMQSLSDRNLYRVGAIGVRGSNNALRRLAQCAPGEPNGAGWRFVALRVVAGSRRECRRWEQQLRAALILNGGAFSRDRVRRSDRFRCRDRPRLLRLFRSLTLDRQS